MTATGLLARPLHGPSVPPLRPLPESVAELLTDLDCPPRPAAHLRAVHDVAHQLVDWTGRQRPAAALDREAVLFGAATHDIGKTLHPAELSGPGSAHEEAGRTLLLGRGVAPELARFAATHASWTAPGVAGGPAGVARRQGVEGQARARPGGPGRDPAAEATGGAAWEEFAALDDLLTAVGEDADRRLAFRASFPASR
jgi:hypothetical protein